MNETFTQTIRITTPMVDCCNNLYPSALLAILQEMATRHADILGIDRDYLVENYHACWILARTWFHLERPIKVGELLTVTTWHRGGKGFVINRDYEFFVGEEYVGQAIGAWVVADLADRKMLRGDNIALLAGSPGIRDPKRKNLRSIRTPEERETVFTKTVRYSDLDVNGHMNNTKYADVMLDAIGEDALRGRYISSLQINYTKECKIGEAMDICRAVTDGHCYIDGCDGEGERRFEANVEIVAEPGILLDEHAENE